MNATTAAPASATSAAYADAASASASPAVTATASASASPAASPAAIYAAVTAGKMAYIAALVAGGATKAAARARWEVALTEHRAALKAGVMSSLSREGVEVERTRMTRSGKCIVTIVDERLRRADAAAKTAAKIASLEARLAALKGG